MTTQQLQCLQDIEREILIGRVMGRDTSHRQHAIYRRMHNRAQAIEVACAIIDKFPCAVLSGWKVFLPEVENE